MEEISRVGTSDIMQRARGIDGTALSEFGGSQVIGIRLSDEIESFLGSWGDRGLCLSLIYHQTAM